MLSHNGMIQYTCKRKVYSEGVFVECYCDKALSTIKLSDIAISIEMIMFTGW